MACGTSETNFEQCRFAVQVTVGGAGVIASPCNMEAYGIGEWHVVKLLNVCTWTYGGTPQNKYFLFYNSVVYDGYTSI